MQVDQDPNTPYVEPAVAANPSNPKNLVGASALFWTSSWFGRSFASWDSGNTWRQAEPPSAYTDLGDVQVAFAPDGNAYFAALGPSPNPEKPSSTDNGLYLFRSTNQGMTWQRRTFLRRAYDHEQLLIDSTASKGRGRIYLYTLYSVRQEPQVNQLGLLYSSDSGRTFQGPVPVATGWNFNSNLAQFSDGTLMIPYIHMDGAPGKFAPYERLEFVTSADGGRSVSTAHTIARRWMGDSKAMLERQRAGRFDWDPDTVPRYAVDASNDRFKDSVYLVWSDMRFGDSRLLFTYSRDRGKSWSQPRILAADSRGTGSQYQASIVTSRSGAVGVSWYDTRDSIGRGYNEYFSASSDGGKTFLRPVRVSSATSYPKGAGNTAFSPAGADLFKGSYAVFLTSPFGRFINGGDYMGLTADKNDTFHPFWIDARSGTYQIYTAAVRLQSGQQAPLTLEGADVTKYVALSFDRAGWDAKSHVVSLPVRIRNTSNRVLYGPFSLKVTLVLLPHSNKYETAELLNAENGKHGIGALYAIAPSSQDARAVAPGAITDGIVWKIKVNEFAVQPTISVQVNGFMEK
ncbi:MAG: hypothetical protein DLM53_00285 [Candidatus Eremiobacter antarcticus]|nr:MAG: hypothetical protein DLM53_00285 [Candidatus Eremiobacter sp. RRmetagenome_bin22]